ncbi:ParB-like partition protein (plasmid) [Leptolyngbya boryana NIES-2135]|uniref:ParB-like partition protein n=1 Tax=Leptolyngbya boryana NIES-2135 TaxID=1973484 RepID=A0A1Z4JSI4_LEPBY|nr:ParB N-terminal domain-containing protein [Leptolyngbya boryana]MBD2371184.1 ParB N-terminal domain-containing protein [Leptolyngbya sp. FACHB-161]MBD2377852.1 ParB N-terminal domain-containing protein [Leptolyngbya sp. FACHB-238]MBD2402290.1 ParB N-terminal domain-containing protein [Leptolyngbya sp. FACHB-239]MBD2409033.1 ParB N-terminal domain-containing protein [Leptolyngbya sp. FACHB-402]BAY59633.1 ParB-like partition protein [Leptolyngbya boryana NIES-2135]
MAKRDRLDIDNFFSEVDQNQELHNLRGKVQSLEEELSQNVEREQQLVSEIEHLRSQMLDPKEQAQLETQIGVLRDHLKGTQGVVKYPVNKVHRNPNQPRQTFDEEVEAMRLSLLKEGQLDPIILFEDGMLFDGECRWRSAEAMGWETIDAVFTARPQDDKTLRRRAYLTSLHRRGLNALDKAETLVAIASDEIPDLPQEDVSRIVNRVLIRLKRKNQSLGDRLHLQPQEEQQRVLEELGLEEIEVQTFLVFLGLQEHPASLNRNIFPTLNLFDDLKAAIRTQRLGCPQALLLNGLSAQKLGITEKQALKLRQKAIKEVTSRNLSTIETRRWVAEQRKQSSKSGEAEDSSGEHRNEQVDQVIHVIRDLSLKDALPVEQRNELKTVLKNVLAQLEKMV